MVGWVGRPSFLITYVAALLASYDDYSSLANSVPARRCSMQQSIFWLRGMGCDRRARSFRGAGMSASADRGGETEARRRLGVTLPVQARRGVRLRID